MMNDIVGVASVPLADAGEPLSTYLRMPKHIYM